MEKAVQTTLFVRVKICTAFIIAQLVNLYLISCAINEYAMMTKKIIVMWLMEKINILCDHFLVSLRSKVATLRISQAKLTRNATMAMNGLIGQNKKLENNNNTR